MQTIFLAILSLSLGLIPLMFLLIFVQKSIRQKFDIAWIRLVWIAVLIRLLLPFSFWESNLFQIPLLSVKAQKITGIDVENTFFWTELSLFSWLVCIWTIVTSLLLLYHLLDYMLFRRHLLRWSHEPEDMGLLEVVEQVRIFWKLPRSLKILIFCPEMKTPAAVGFWAPVILLPTEHFDDTDLELILHHEAAHLRRGDIFIKWASMIVKCLYWFHPLVHIFCNRLEDDLEAACDAAVMKKVGQEQEIQKYYSYLILDIAAGKSGRYYPFTTCLQDTRECLRARIDNIFDRSPKRSGFPLLVLCSFCLLISSHLVQLQLSVDEQTMPEVLVEEGDVSVDPEEQSVVTIDLYQLEQQLEGQET